MIKHLNGWEISKKIRFTWNILWGPKQFKWYATLFKKWIKPFNSSFGTNSLDYNKIAEGIANAIIDLARSLKIDQNFLSISSILLRMDNTNLNEKRCLVNIILVEICKKKSIYLIDHYRKMKSHHLNRSKLHLNKNGDTSLSNNFIREVFRVFNLQIKNNSSRNSEGM